MASMAGRKRSRLKPLAYSCSGGWLEVATTTTPCSKEHLEQPTEDDRVADVADEQLVEAQHANFLRKRFRQRLQRISRAIELEQPDMHPAHEMVEMLAARRHWNAGVEDVHQPGLATADRAPQVDPGRRAVSATQRLVAGLQ